MLSTFVPSFLEDKSQENSEQRENSEKHEHSEVPQIYGQAASKYSSNGGSYVGTTDSSCKPSCSVSRVVDRNEGEDCDQDDSSGKSLDYSSHYSPDQEEERKMIGNEVAHSIQDESQAHDQKS